MRAIRRGSRLQGGRAVAGAGGTYTVTPEGYSETVSYAVGQNQQPLIGTTTKFTWSFEGGKWHHKGTLRAGQTKQEIDEIWDAFPKRSSDAPGAADVREDKGAGTENGHCCLNVPEVGSGHLIGLQANRKPPAHISLTPIITF